MGWWNIGSTTWSLEVFFRIIINIYNSSQRAQKSVLSLLLLFVCLRYFPRAQIIINNLWWIVNLPWIMRFISNQWYNDGAGSGLDLVCTIVHVIDECRPMNYRRNDTAGKLQSPIKDRQPLVLLRRLGGIHTRWYIGTAWSQSPCLEDASRPLY